MAMTGIRWVIPIRSTWPWWAIRLVNWQAGIAWHGKLLWHRLRGRTVVRVEFGTERIERIILEKSQEIFVTPEFRRTVVVRIPRPEVFEWLQNNATADVEYMTAPGHAVMFVFKNKNDAFAFKVRWF